MIRHWLLLLLLVWPAAAPAHPNFPAVGYALADDDDDDRDENDDEDDAPARRRVTPRPAPAPPALTAQTVTIRRIWVERSGTNLAVVRVGLERGGSILTTLTLHPTTLTPVPYTQRGLAQPRAPLTAAKLKATLQQLAQASPRQLSIGTFATASSTGVQLPVYWAGKHVAYLTLNRQGLPVPDSRAASAYASSTLKVSR